MKNAVGAGLLILILLPGICRSAPPPTAPLDFGQPWALIESMKNTKIYQRPWPYSGISTFKVDTILDAGMNEILAVITDIASYPLWVPDWLIEWAARSQVMKSLENIKKVLKK